MSAADAPARTAAVRATLAAAGIPVTDAGAAAARARRRAVEATWTPARFAAVRRHVRRIAAAEPAGDAARHSAA